MENKGRTYNRRRLTGFFLVIMILFSTFGTQVATVNAFGVSTGSSGAINAMGTKKGLSGELLHVDQPTFRLGVMRNTDMWQDGTSKSRQAIIDTYAHKFPANEDSIFLTPAGNSSKYTNVVIGKYVSSSRTIEEYKDTLSKSRVIHLKGQSSKPSLDAKTALTPYSLSKIGGTKSYEELANGKWKSLINSQVTVDEANRIWSYITAQTGSSGGVKTYEVEDRMNDLVSQYANDFVNLDDYTDEMREDLMRGYLALLMTAWVLVPDNAELRAPWENAIEDYLTGHLQYKDGMPSVMVVDTAQTFSYGNPNRQLVVPSVDYFMYYTAVGTSFDIRKENELGAASGNTNDMMEAIVDGTIKTDKGRNVSRTSDYYNDKNIFSFGAATALNPYYRLKTTSTDAAWVSDPDSVSSMSALVLGRAARYLAPEKDNYDPTVPSLSKGHPLLGWKPTNNTTPKWNEWIEGSSIINLRLLLKKPPTSLILEVKPTNTLLPASQETIGRPVNLSIKFDPKNKTGLSEWNSVLSSMEDPKVKVTVGFERTVVPSKGENASITSTGGTYLTGYEMTEDEFRAFLQGKTSLDFIDNVASDAIAEGEKKVYTYTPTVTFDYKVYEENVKQVVKPTKGTSTFTRPADPPELIKYTSEPSAFAELKNDMPDGEDFDAMAGVPSNKRLYLGVGGSEFIVDVELEYEQDVDSVWRTYRSYFTGTPSQFKAGDTSPNKSIGGHSADMHNGGLYTKSWSGSIPNNGSAASGTGSATSTAVPDMSAYNAHKAEAAAYIASVNATTHSHTAASDGKTRTQTGWNARITTDAPSPPQSVTETNYTTESYSCGTTEAPKTCERQKGLPVTASPSGAGSYSITVTFTVPAHIIDGPECTYDLPLVEDNWKQRISYDYLKISKAEVYKIEEGRITNVDNLFGAGNSELKASIQKGDPTFFYNIAEQNAGGDDVAAQSSKHGRLRYSLEQDQHDVVVWNEGVRSNTSAGMGANGSSYAPQGGGHNNAWAKGILYDNKTQSTEKDFHASKGGKNSTITNKADSVDVTTPEWKKFDERRKALNKAVIISDALILQTSSGDQSVIYFDKESKEVQSQEQFPDVQVEKKEMWENNPNSAANWNAQRINLGSYNGNFESTGTSEATNQKYWGYNQQTKSVIDNRSAGNQVATAFDAKGAGTNYAMKRPVRPSKMYLYTVKDIVPTTKNGLYVTGNAETFFAHKLTWKSPSAYDAYPGVQLQPDLYTAEVQPNFSSKKGLVLDSPYSKNHSKVNDVVIHTPVSAQDAMIISLPKYMDQRTEMPAGGAASLIDEQLQHENDKANAAQPNFFTPAVEKLITSDSVIRTTKKTSIKKAGNTGGKGEKSYVYTNSVQTFIAPADGTYLLEVWGAQGSQGFLNGVKTVDPAGLGGYAKGSVTLKKGDTLNLLVGGKGVGNASKGTGGFNGGGSTADTDADNDDAGGAGGGATDIRKGGESLANRIIVAGGGGGSGIGSGAGGDGGGLTGADGRTNSGGIISGGTQTTGHSLGVGSHGLANGGGVSGAGGGGYYGGKSSGTTYYAGGSGGSGYIGGVTNGVTTSGGNTGDGKAKISYDIPAEPTEEEISSEELEPVTTSNTSTSKSGDPTGYKGYTWEQLFGPNWQDYITVKTTTSTETSTSTTETSYDEKQPVKEEEELEEVEVSPNLGVPVDFKFTGEPQTWTVPEDGLYTLETWGAQGGNADYNGSVLSEGGKGGYAKGVKRLNKGEILHIYAGGQGALASSSSPKTSVAGGYNGGGNGMTGEVGSPASGGGGATDIRLSGHDLTNRIIVAGGGAGGSYYTPYGTSIPGVGGGASGTDGGTLQYPAGTGYSGRGGTQTAGGAGGANGNGSQAGKLGFGGGVQFYSSYNQAGGGGGYYGGGSAGVGMSAGGGSGYIGGLSQAIQKSGISTGNGRATIMLTSTANGESVSPVTDPFSVMNFQGISVLSSSVRTFTIPTSARVGDTAVIVTANANSENNQSYAPTPPSGFVKIGTAHNGKQVYKKELTEQDINTSLSIGAGGSTWGFIFFTVPRGYDMSVIASGADRITYDSKGAEVSIVSPANLSSLNGYNAVSTAYNPLSLYTRDFEPSTSFPIPVSGTWHGTNVTPHIIFTKGSATPLPTDTNGTGGVSRVFNATGTGSKGADVNQSTGELSGSISMASGMYLWTVPKTGTYTIDAYGAQGGSGDATYVGGKGARMKGDFELKEGQVLKLLVGQKGSGDSANGGGGGGSFVVDSSNNTPLIVAGGGGGLRQDVLQNGNVGRAEELGSTSSIQNQTGGGISKSASTLRQGGIVSSPTWGSAGAGFEGNGASDAGGLSYSFLNGGIGGGGSAPGGFGGGGSGNGSNGGGGGGGYSGGDGGRVAGGGGSFNSGINTSNESGVNISHGKVVITLKGKVASGYEEGASKDFNATGSLAHGANIDKSSGNLIGDVTLKDGMYIWTVPETGNYRIQTNGASGGGHTSVLGGKGAKMEGVFKLQKGDKLTMLVGQKGQDGSHGGGGGGGTFVTLGENYATSTPLIISGGGGGAYGVKGQDGVTATSGTNGLLGSEYGIGGKDGNGGGASGYSNSTTGGGGFFTAGEANGSYGIAPQGFRQGGKGSNTASGAVIVSGGFGGGATAWQSGSGGAAAGGYSGGGGQHHGQGIGGGGGSFNSGESQNNLAGSNTGDGKITITSLIPISAEPEEENVTIKLIKTNEITVTTVATTTTVNEEKVKADLALLPDKMPDGTWNPIKLGFGVKIPLPPSPNDTPTETTSGGLLQQGNFINIDNSFQIFFPNKGDFAQQPTLDGISTVTSIRGRGYNNDMDTTQYTEKKRVKFDFNVIYNDVLYRTGSWITLDVNEEYFDFYAVLANKEAVGSLVEFEAVPINASPAGDPQNDNYQEVTNKDRFADLSAYHGAYKKTYVDVVGRIGNFAVSDTEDFRFSNLFKQPVCSDDCTDDDWVVDGLVKKVDTGKQNRYYGDNTDIRGVDINATGHRLNTYGTQTWLEHAPLSLPINPKDNQTPSLKEQFLKPGYDIFSDISTVGNYQEGVVRVLPYYYKLDLETGKIIPLDVYQKSGEEYKPVNKYQAADGGSVPSDIYPYDLIIDWENESKRRNYSMDESIITDKVAEIHGEYAMGLVETPNGTMEEGIVGVNPLTTPAGNFASIGNAQRIVADKGARTFIGTEKTYGVDKNLGSKVVEDDWNYAAQRWHLKFGMPASSVFVETGKQPTKENMASVLNGNGVLLMAADIVSIGELYSLRWEQPNVNSITVEKEGMTRVFDISKSGLPPVISLYDLSTTAIGDVDVQGSH